MASTSSLEPIKTHLDRLLTTREYPKTLCPSEVARALSKDELQTAGACSWRDLMQPIREMVFKLRDDEQLEILQKGSVIPASQDLHSTHGPIRIRKTTDG